MGVPFYLLQNVYQHAGCAGGRVNAKVLPENVRLIAAGIVLRALELFIGVLE